MPAGSYPQVIMAHGGGGRLTHQLIEKVFLAALSNPGLNQDHDGATLAFPPGRLAFTTDSFVVRPLQFPGGDIGKLAVCGTVNDLAMCGARPLWLSAGWILEEGLPLSLLQHVVRSMATTARDARIQIVTGDTKVVDRGKGDGIYINTAGIGVLEHDLPISPRSIQPGDHVVVSGDLGRHGIAIMSVREGLEFESVIESDCALLSPLVLTLLEAQILIRCLRDLTRGGLATALNEIAVSANLTLVINESQIPVREDVRGACELLGLDPFYVANEGRLVAIVPPEQSKKTVDLLRTFSMGAQAAVIGQVAAQAEAPVILNSLIGAPRILDVLSGEQLPRIC